MIEYGREACFMKDKKGFLPAHVACSRHCSPEKLRMLLAVNPGSLHDMSYDGKSLLSLATSTATKSHPNYALIDELNRQLQLAESYRSPTTTGQTFSAHLISSEESDASRGRLDSNDSDKSLQAAEPFLMPPPRQRKRSRRRQSKHRHAVDVTHVSPQPSFQGPVVSPAVDPVDLLLHFSRNGSPQTSSVERQNSKFPSPSQYAEV